MLLGLHAAMLGGPKAVLLLIRESLTQTYFKEPTGVSRSKENTHLLMTPQ
jgi:hypothetical protein